MEESDVVLCTTDVISIYLSRKERNIMINRATEGLPGTGHRKANGKMTSNPYLPIMEGGFRHSYNAIAT